MARYTGPKVKLTRRAASSLTASMNGMPRASVKKRIASPCAPQPKQW